MPNNPLEDNASHPECQRFALLNAACWLDGGSSSAGNQKWPSCTKSARTAERSPALSSLGWQKVQQGPELCAECNKHREISENILERWGGGGRGEEQLDECSNLPSSSPIVFVSTYNSQYFLRRDESSQSGLFFFYAINTSEETCGQLSKWHSCPRAHIRQGNFGRVTPPDLLGLKSCCARYRLSPTVNLDSLQKKFNCAYAIAHLSRTTSCSCTRRGFCGLCQIWPERLQTHFCLCYSPASQPEIVILTQTNLIQETETYSFTFYLNLRSNKQKQGCHTPYFRHSKACTALASIGYLQQQQGQLCTGNTGNNCTYKKQVAINISHTVWSWLYLANADANYLLIWFNFFPMTP